jgi:OmpA-OmpF porin, OOP family
MRWRPSANVSLLLVVSVALPVTAHAQLGKKIRDAARGAAEREALQQVDRQVSDAVRCVLTDQACIEKARKEGRKVEVVDAQGKPVPAIAQGGAAVAPAVSPVSGVASDMRVGEGAWANYDFVPGDRVLFVEELAADRVGNFPRRLEFRKGNLEIVEWQGGRFLRSTAEGSFDVVLAEPLPERFTLEFDLYDPDFWATEVYTVDDKRDPESYSRAFFAFNGESGLRTGSAMKAAMKRAPGDTMMRVSLIADGKYVKLFLNETRIANVPNADVPRTNRLRFDLHGKDERPVLIGNIRVAAGSTSLYDRLNADGRVTTQGILFDSGSDRIRPESTPTLKEIGTMLREYPTLRLRIEGHTDNVGQATANLQLSEKRAAAVKQQLVSGYGIDAARLESVGKGQAESATSNDTPEGRQNNRRVVLVRR